MINTDPKIIYHIIHQTPKHPIRRPTAFHKLEIRQKPSSPPPSSNLPPDGVDGDGDGRRLPNPPQEEVPPGRRAAAQAKPPSGQEALSPVQVPPAACPSSGTIYITILDYQYCLVQHDEHRSTRRDDETRSRRASEQRKWNDPMDQSEDKVSKVKVAANNEPDKDEKSEARKDDRVWKHDGYYELEAGVPGARKRRTFRETKLPAENANAEHGATRPPRTDRPELNSEKREGRSYNPRELGRYERPFGRTGGRDHRREDMDPRAGTSRYSYHSRGGRGSGVDGRPGDQYNGRNPTLVARGDFQVDKWKHDLFDEANKSPEKKNEEDQIAEVEALLSL